MTTLKKHKKERKEVASFMRRLYNRGLTTSSGGNISCLADNELIAITSSVTDKGTIRWKEVGLISIFGENLTPTLKPSMEIEMHLAIYRKNKEVKAIIHAHPLFATTFTAMNHTINTALTAESCVILGQPLFLPYALMGSQELADMASKNISKSDILLLENHGILATGTNLLQAFDKIEVLEYAAKMTLFVELMKKKSPLSKTRILEIDKLFRT